MSKCISWLENIESFTELLQLIAEPHRLKILCILAQNWQEAQNGFCVSYLVEALKKPQNLVSHHLSMLKRAQIVLAKREGKHIRYRLNYEVYNKLKDALQIVFHLK